MQWSYVNILKHLGFLRPSEGQGTSLEKDLGELLRRIGGRFGDGFKT